MDQTATLMYLGGLDPARMRDGGLDYLEATELVKRLRKMREDDLELLITSFAKAIGPVMRIG